MKRRIEAFGDWLDQRTGIAAASALSRRRYSRLERLASGVRQRGAVPLYDAGCSPDFCSPFNYAPTPGEAYDSLRYIVTEVTARKPDARPASLGREHDDRGSGAPHGPGVSVRGL